MNRASHFLRGMLDGTGCKRRSRYATRSIGPAAGKMSGWIALAAIFLAGCKATEVKKPAPPPATGPSSLTLTIQPLNEQDPRDPQQTPSAMVHLVIFMLDMPPGSVSNNSDFWKRVDETAVGTANSDRLIRNGVRCGIVSQSEGLFFSQFFDHLPHKLSTSHVDGLHAETFPLQMEKQFDRQDLFFFNASNQLEGRSYDRGTDQLMLSFGPAPRDPGAVKVTLCPVVHSQKVRMGFTAMNDEFESPVQDVDSLYDLGLTADVPENYFMIIAPSGDADRRTSVGACFLTRADKTERKEQVIVIVPTLLRLDGKPMLVRGPLLK